MTEREGYDKLKVISRNNSPKEQTMNATQNPTRCPKHRAYEADYCPFCGTARIIGGTK